MKFADLSLILAVLALAGCTTGRPMVLTPPQIPALPPSLASVCGDPGVRADQPALGEIARQRLALAECRRKHRDTVAFYNDLRQRLGE